MAVEEARVKNIAVSTSKHQHKMMLTINISPSFLASTGRRNIREAAAIRWGGGWLRGKKRMMP
jgi:hypothetical protein